MWAPRAGASEIPGSNNFFTYIGYFVFLSGLQPFQSNNVADSKYLIRIRIQASKIKAQNLEKVLK
jgi:hypothetical protein